MHIRIQSDQVPLVWDAIKLASVRSNSIDDKYAPSYLNTLLCNLLSGKAQCFVRLSEKRELLAVAITKVVADDITGVRSLIVESLYSFKPADTSIWQEGIDLIRKFAEVSECSFITTYSRTDRVCDLVESIGMNKHSTRYTMEV